MYKILVSLKYVLLLNILAWIRFRFRRRKPELGIKTLGFGASL